MNTEEAMNSLLYVSVIITLWAVPMALCLPRAFRLQLRPKGLPAVRIFYLPFAPRIVMRAAALFLALAKTKF